MELNYDYFPRAVHTFQCNSEKQYALKKYKSYYQSVSERAILSNSNKAFCWKMIYL